MRVSQCHKLLPVAIAFVAAALPLASGRVPFASLDRRALNETSTVVAEETAQPQWRNRYALCAFYDPEAKGHRVPTEAVSCTAGGGKTP
ncbi:unnamed protein product [Vitrella brassicaformis CCMP3155]|uniref:Uncharacterized protein n=1 Tax=Vitrella brassicaformis (strain CCMP3155) TaxID=1169540 RepID=A0A0G4GL98_VITBC|nr:unnamed protein product [Vitrella brassicaformis CCMP3155]|eukprot:CEM30838.1 unnamed protein product [Vitrella brassicaformis CCMP3155]